MQGNDKRRKRKTLDPKLDIVFWMLFGSDQNRDLLISLLNAVLNPARPIESVEVLPSQPERLAASEKSISLDVRVRLQGGEQVDVEMQSQRRPAIRERALYYWARLFTSQQQRGAPYTALRRCVVVLITNFVELKSQRFHSVFQVRERHSSELLTGHLELHLLELPKLPSAFDKNDEPTLALWGKFLSAKADEELEELAMEHPVLKQAKAALDRLSADDVARLQAEQREMALITFEAGMAAAREDARQEGLEEGRQQGLQEGRQEGLQEGRQEGRQEGLLEGRTAGTAEVLLRLLTLKFGPQPPSVAERLNNASQAELVRWSERLLSAETLASVFA
jgi:predicted transposase/invertase (TIGR01784 family)